MSGYFLVPCLLLGSLLSAAEPQTLFFEHENARDYTRISLTIEGEKVTGTQTWLPKQPDGHGAHGTISGIITSGGMIQVLYEYSIEGSDQSEEEVLRLDGEKLFIGKGELQDAGNGRMNLKEPNKVGFTTALKKVTVTEPKTGTPERKAIMDSMRGPVSEYVGKPVQFTGKIRAMGSWARFFGKVAPADGKAPKNEDIAADLELDFVALLQKDTDGAWQTLHWGFAGDTSVMEEAREKYAQAPWPLFEWVP